MCKATELAGIVMETLDRTERIRFAEVKFTDGTGQRGTCNTNPKVMYHESFFKLNIKSTLYIFYKLGKNLLSVTYEIKENEA